MTYTKPKAISLFSGIGAFDLGVSLAGFNIIAQAETDTYCRKVLARHAPAHWADAVQFVDVSEVTRNAIADQDVALIFGGFPCQPFSLRGVRKGGSDSKNGWPAMRDAISDMRPRRVLLENVPGITQAYTLEGEIQPAYALTVIADLAAMGYDAQWGVISARDAGAAHERKRWWLVAHTNGQRQDEFKKIRYQSQLTARSAAQKRLQKVFESRLGRATNAIANGLDITRRPACQGEDQHNWEAPRTTPSIAAHSRKRIKALGNSGMWQIVYTLAVEIRKTLEAAS